MRMPRNFRFALDVIRSARGIHFHIARSGEGHHPLMTVWMAFRAGVGAGAKNKYPGRLDYRWKFIAEYLQPDSLPRHQRLRLVSEIFAHPTCDWKNLHTNLLRMHKFIQDFEK